MLVCDFRGIFKVLYSGQRCREVIAGSLLVFTWLEGILRQAQDSCGDQHQVGNKCFDAKNRSCKGKAVLCPQALLLPSKTWP